MTTQLFTCSLFVLLLVTKASADTMCYGCNFVYRANTGSFATLADPTSFTLHGVSNAGILVSDSNSLYLYSNGVYSPLGINQINGVISSNGTIASNGNLYNSVGQKTGTYSVTLPPESSPYLYAFPPSVSPAAITDSGVLAGSASYLDTTTTPNNYTSHGFITTASQTQIFDPPGSFSTIISGINSSGTIVGEAALPSSPGSDFGFDHAFVYQDGQLTYFSVPGSTSTSFNGINDEGEIIGTFSVLDNPGASIYERIYTDYGFIYDSSNGTYRLLNDPFGVSTSLSSIDDAGDITGTFSTPEPSTMGLLLFAGACFAGGLVRRTICSST